MLKNNLITRWILTLAIIFCIAVITNAQSAAQLKQNLKQNPHKTIEKISPDKEIYKITDKQTGNISYMNLGHYKPPKSTFHSQSVDTTVFYPDSIDLEQYSEYYMYWRTVDAGGRGNLIVCGDINENGLPEIYGRSLNSLTDISERSIYEYNDISDDFDYKTDLPWDSISHYSQFKQIYDVNRDGKKELFIGGSWDDQPYQQLVRSFKLDDSTNLPTKINFNYITENNTQPNDLVWGEYDKMEGADLFYCGTASDNLIVTADYNKNTNSVETKYVYHTPEDIFYLAGTSNGDIDDDGYADLVVGGVYGDIIVFEYQEDLEKYSDVWYGDAGTYNVYVHFFTNDLNGNGKKEFWVGGEAFYNNFPITRFTCFEAVGDNDYQPVHVIDVMNRFSVDAFNGFKADINNDSKEEIGLCLGSTIMILKFSGDKDSWKFDLNYLRIKKNDQPIKYYGAMMYDVNNDDYEELLIMKQEMFNNYQEYKIFTEIYKPTNIVSVDNEEPVIKDYRLNQNYPNPFNPRTKISYVIPEESFVNIAVYNVIGEKIETLVNRLQNKGSYEVIFNGNNLRSGVYLIRMHAGSYVETIKALLLK